MDTELRQERSIYQPMGARDVEQLTRLIIFRGLELFSQEDLMPIETYKEGELLAKFPSLEHCWCMMRKDKLIGVLGLFEREDEYMDYPEMVVNIFSGPELEQVRVADLALVWDKGIEYRILDDHIKA